MKSHVYVCMYDSLPIVQLVIETLPEKKNRQKSLSHNTISGVINFLQFQQQYTLLSCSWATILWEQIAELEGPLV